MNQEKFANLLLYPHSDEKPEVSEVERMIVRYPYCQSFHILKAKMQAYTNSTDTELSLNLAATYTADRTFLYHVMQNLHAPKTVDMPQQLIDLTAAFDNQVLVLEEPPVSEFEILVTPPTQSTSNTLSINETPPTNKTTSATEPIIILPLEEPALVEENLQSTPISPIEILDTKKEEIIDNQGITADKIPFEIEEITLEETTSENAPSTDFMTWLSGLEAPEIRSFNQPNTPKPVKVRKVISKPTALESPKVIADKGKRLKKLIEKSVAKDEQIISETLAELLVLQGKKKKAIKMYQQLSLKFPEKSANFAAQIEKLVNG